MKRIILAGCILLTTIASFSQIIPPKEEKRETKDSFYTLSPVEVRAIRAAENAPFTKTNISAKEIAKANLGQDIPFLLNQTPSVVVNSDAGNGIGYTGMRIRGSDATRINVTLNGIPYNDAESQGTFFVDLPDLLSSTNSIQIQRGVGTSSNGAGAFGASINFSTNEISKTPYGELNNSFGSFNSFKHTIKAGTGLKRNTTTDFRLSRVSSDGFIDRASSSLHSFYVSTGWAGMKSSLRGTVLYGQEKTYQAWYGISQADLDAGNRRINYAGTERYGDPYNNETDNYQQTHYQLLFNHETGNRMSYSTSLFYTKGRGYYEQYKAGQNYADYNLPNVFNGIDTIRISDMVRQLWLDNDFYGTVFSAMYNHNKMKATLGGGFSRYAGGHFGRINWAAKGFADGSNLKYYDLAADKNDFQLYFKQQSSFSNYWTWHYELQYRHVDYDLNGFRNNPSLVVSNQFNFLNPKLGLSYRKNRFKTYLSFAIANKEPNRDDFEAGKSQQPKPERLYDAELGFEKTGMKVNWSATFYYMYYHNQLVLTGQINDVGAYTRTNIPRSYRAGIELQGGVKLNKLFALSGNIAVSGNKVKKFTEFIDDYDLGGQKTNQFNSTAIAFSPAVVASTTLTILPAKNLEINFLGKYVSRQYLDNTENKGRSLDPFFTEDLRVNYSIKILKKKKELALIGQLNNLFGEKYEPNGYTFSYILGGQTITENYYFPMAGTNFMIGVNISL